MFENSYFRGFLWTSEISDATGRPNSKNNTRRATFASGNRRERHRPFEIDFRWREEHRSRSYYKNLTASSHSTTLGFSRSYTYVNCGSIDVSMGELLELPQRNFEKRIELLGGFSVNERRSEEFLGTKTSSHLALVSDFT